VKCSFRIVPDVEAGFPFQKRQEGLTAPKDGHEFLVARMDEHKALPRSQETAEIQERLE